MHSNKIQNLILKYLYVEDVIVRPVTPVYIGYNTEALVCVSCGLTLSHGSYSLALLKDKIRNLESENCVYLSKKMYYNELYTLKKNLGYGFSVRSCLFCECVLHSYVFRHDVKAVCEGYANKLYSKELAYILISLYFASMMKHENKGFEKELFKLLLPDVPLDFIL